MNQRARYARDIDLKLAHRVLAKGWDLAPSNEQKAHLLLGLAEVEVRMARAGGGAAPEKALATVTEVFEKFPLTRAAAGARTLAVSIHLYGGRLERIEDFDRQPADAPAKALALLRQLQKKGDVQRAGLDEALLDIAWNYQHKKDYDRGEPLLLEIVRDYSSTASAPKAMLRLANVYAAKGDKLKQEEWLQRAAKRKDGDARGVQTEASFRLAKFHEDKGQWEEALKHWRAYQPSSFCGTCLASMQAERAPHIALCHAHLGDHAAAAQVLWNGLTKDGLGWSSHLAPLLFQLYRDAGQLNDLRRSVEALEQVHLRDIEQKGYFKHMKREEILAKYVPTWPLRKMEQVQALADKKDVDALIEICQASNWVHTDTSQESNARGDWLCRAAAEALAAYGGKEVEPIKAAILGRKGNEL